MARAASICWRALFLDGHLRRQQSPQRVRLESVDRRPNRRAWNDGHVERRAGFLGGVALSRGKAASSRLVRSAGPPQPAARATGYRRWGLATPAAPARAISRAPPLAPTTAPASTPERPPTTFFQPETGHGCVILRRRAARLLVHEGGYTNHPADPGGPTNFGITIYDYRKYVKPGATAADVQRDEARRSQGDLPRQILGRAALRRTAGRRRLRGVRLRREFRHRPQQAKCCSRVLGLPTTTSVAERRR